MELLKLGANPSLYDPTCDSSLTLAIKLNDDCDLFYIKELLKYDADLNPGFFQICNFSYDPLLQTIFSFNQAENEACCIAILELITTKMQKVDLNQFNDDEHYKENIIYFCLKKGNMTALKYFIVDLKCKVPDKIYIDPMILKGYMNYIDLRDVLEHRSYDFERGYREKAKNEILAVIKERKVYP